MNTYSYIFFILLTLTTLTKLYLSYRNRLYIKKNSSKVPLKFSEKVTLSEHQKAAKYTIHKSKFGSILLILNLLFTLIWLPLGLLNILDLWLRSFNYSEIWTGTLLFAIFSAISFLIGLPTSIYDTFILEESYGFNKTTPKIFITDILKQIILGAIIGFPLLLAILWIMISLGNLWWLYAWSFLTLFQLILMWIYPSLIAPLFNKFSPLPDGELKTKLQALLERINFPNKGLYVMDASKRSNHGNAYFTGFGKNRRIVLFDTLIKTITSEEVEAVLAHELGHFKKKHIFKMIIISTLFSLIGFWILGVVSANQAFYTGHFITHKSTYMALMLFSIILSFYTYFLTPFMSWLSRKHEFEADKFAHDYSDSKFLISGLVNLYKDNANTLTPDPLFSAFYHSHPPALERVEHLEKL